MSAEPAAVPAVPVGEVVSGDCVEVMAAWPAASIDAVVTDPPYGLEFMGKAWDRLGDVGAVSHAGPTERDPEHVHGRLRVAYNGSANRRCRACGHWAYSGTPCTCATPDFPSVVNAQALLMQEWHQRWAVEAFRVLKPGGHLLAFGGTRTYHRLVCAIEDAGFEVRDCLVWAYAQGFPKSLDVAKAIDRQLGKPRDVAGRGAAVDRTALDMGGATGKAKNGLRSEWQADDEPNTDEAAAWQGWGTALKPAWEPIVLARKPLAGSVARNVLEHGTGALNIDGTRIPHDGTGVWGDHGQHPERHVARPGGGGTTMRDSWQRPGSERSDLGRWPANVVLTDALFDGDMPGVVGGGEQSGGGNPPRRNVGDDERVAYRDAWYGDETGRAPVDTAGTYSRFFLIAKASRDDREPILRGLPERQPPGWSSGEQSPGTFQSRPTPPRQNVHPTVKPTELMRHLVRLVTPPGGLVLDPFLGSGTTAVAAEREGFRWVGIELDPDSVETALARLNGEQRGMGLDVEAPAPKRASRASGRRRPEPVTTDEGFGL